MFFPALYTLLYTEKKSNIFYMSEKERSFFERLSADYTNAQNKREVVSVTTSLFLWNAYPTGAEKFSVLIEPWNSSALSYAK